MTAEQFAYWLQGFVELSADTKQPTEEQWQAIKDHLQTVFVKVTPTITPRPSLIPSTLPRLSQLEEAMRGIPPGTVTC